MNLLPPRSKLALSVIATAVALPSIAQAAFVEDGKASLELRNMYLNRDFRDGVGPNGNSYGETWAQGFISKFESGFTDGAAGVGVDALAMLGIKLDSGPGRSEGNMLPLNTDGAPVDSYSELGLTAKASISKTVLRVGTLQPQLPVVQYNNTRLLPGSYVGGMLTSQEITGLTLNAGRLTQYNLRDSTDNQDFESAYRNYRGSIDSFDFVGGAYALSPQLVASYYYGDYDNAFNQNFVGLVHNLPLGEGVSLRSDLRYFKSKDQGDKAMGVIDNDMCQGMFALGVGAHKFSLAYQNLSGDGGFPFIAGSDPYSVNLVTYWTFARQEEEAWQARYDYDFAAQGLPGLSFMTRYVSGNNIEAANGGYDDGKEWERDTDLAYALQGGPLKGLRFHLRNTTYRAESKINFRDVDENRVIVSYSIPLL